VIRILTKDTIAHFFILPPDREAKLLYAWRVFRDDPKYGKKVFVFTDSHEKKTKIKISDIVDLLSMLDTAPLITEDSSKIAETLNTKLE
jgi:hypothetical protein